jgi:hypothetical protein
MCFYLHRLFTLVKVLAKRLIAALRLSLLSYVWLTVFY